MGSVVLVLVVVMGLAGLDQMMNELDRYTADLTKGHGDFTTLDKFSLYDATAPIALQPKIRITYTILPP